MPEINKILPKEKLSTREKVERKIRSFEGRPWALRDINRLLRPRMSQEALRFHVENLVNNLLVEKLPREGREPQLYVYRDLLKDIEFVENAQYVYGRLNRLAQEIRQGKVVPQFKLNVMRAELRDKIDELQAEATDLAKLHDCIDLWNPITLVDRIGFNEEES